MSHSIPVSILLRRFAASLPPPPEPAPVADWNLMFDAVKTQLRVRPDLAFDAAAALESLHRQLHAERQAQAHVARELAVVQSRLLAAQAALAESLRRERLERHSAVHDSLTELPNRAYFRRRLDEALRSAGPVQGLAVMVLDLDGFKAVNDTHGHAAGDELLRVVAARLARSVRGSDVVARLGGDEFACVLNGLPDRERLRRMAEDLVEAISAPIALDRLRLSVRPSIGIAVHDGAADGEALIRRADAAMFTAKRSRSGPAFCDGELA